MPSPFAAALTEADVAIDDEMAEMISIVPRARGDFAVIIDAERSVIDCVALVDFVDPSSADLSALDARAPYEELEAQVRRAALPVGAVIRKGDEVLLLDRAGTPRTKVGRVNGNDPERIYLTLAPIGGA